MNVAKNGKSIFYNLIELTASLSEEEKHTFSTLAKKKRENPKYMQLFNKINALIGIGETTETIDEKEFKKVEHDLTSNFNKLSGNLYNNVLSFITEQYKIVEWKSWQIAAEQNLLEIESLVARKLYSQAAAQILKLEDKIKTHDDLEQIRIYNDRYIYSRLADLKIRIAVFNEALYSIDEMDNIMHNLLQMGDFFYSNFYVNSNDWSLSRHKSISYELLAKYLLDKQEYNAALNWIQRNIQNLRVSSDINADKTMLLNYYNLFEAFLKARNGDNNEDFYYNLRDSYKTHYLPQVILLEQQINEIQLALSLKNNETDKIAALDIFGLVQYSEKKIAVIATRREINNSIIHYLSKNFDKSLEIILSLKPQNKDKKSSLYLNILFLELLVRLQLGEFDVQGITRSIRNMVDENNDLFFEQKAVRLLEKWAILAPFGRKTYPVDNQVEIKQLEEFSREIEVMHNLILFTLKGKA